MEESATSTMGDATPDGIGPDASGPLHFVPPPYASPSIGWGYGSNTYGRILLGIIFVVIGTIMTALSLFSWQAIVHDVLQSLGIIFRLIGAVIVAVALMHLVLMEPMTSEWTRLGAWVATGLVLAWGVL